MRRLAIAFSLLSFVAACNNDRAIVARVGAARITVAAIKRRFATLDQDEQQHYAANVRELVEKEIRREIFLAEARRRGLADAADDRLLAALEGQLQAEAARSVPDEALTEDEIQRGYEEELRRPDRRFTYFPERYQVSAMIFEDAADARAAARALAPGARDGFLQVYAARARPLLARGQHPESWEFFLMKGDQSRAALWAAAAGARVGDVVGPVESDGRAYVLKLLDHITEVGTLAEVKTMVVTSLLEERRREAALAAEERVARSMRGEIDEKVLATLVLGAPAAPPAAPPPAAPATPPPVAAAPRPAAAGRLPYEPHPAPANPPNPADMMRALAARNAGLANVAMKESQ